VPFGCRNILLICQLYNMVFLDFDVVVDFVLMIIKYYLSIFHQDWNSIFACGHKLVCCLLETSLSRFLAPVLSKKA